MEGETTGNNKSLSVNVNTHGNFPFIFRLPSETLEAIFIHCAHDYHCKDSGSPTPTAPSWVNVSYVCRHWRNIALNCPTLWAYLFLTSQRWTEEVLARSKQVPLKLHLKMFRIDKNVSGLHLVEQVMNYVDRIQEFRLHATLVFMDHQVFSKLSSPAPLLQDLQISLTSVFPEWEWPSVLFDGNTPALRTLELMWCPVSWYSFKLNGLTTLILHHIPSRFHQNTVEFLATLSCMQDLTHLHLEDALASAVGFLSSTAFNTFRRFTLPHLSRLWISAPFSTVIAFLSCVNIPLKTKVRSQCHYEYGSSLNDYHPLSLLLAQRFAMFEDQALYSPTIRSLIIKFKETSAILVFSASEHDYDFHASPSYLDWGYNIPFQITIYLGDNARVASDICGSIPLTNVQSVHVIHPPFSSEFWSKTLGHLSNLRHLKLSKGKMPELTSLLLHMPRVYTENQGRHVARDPDWVFAPTLEELELDDIRFSTKAVDVRSLCDALSSRKESPVRLNMVGCVQGYTSTDIIGRREDGLRLFEENSRRCNMLLDRRDSESEDD